MIFQVPPKNLLNYSFPGNVRELMAIIELGAVMAEGHMLDDEHIQFNRISRAEDLLHLDLTMEEYKRIHHQKPCWKISEPGFPGC